MLVDDKALSLIVSLFDDRTDIEIGGELVGCVFGQEGTQGLVLTTILKDLLWLLKG